MKHGWLTAFGLFLLMGSATAQIRFYSLQEVLDYADAHAIAIQQAEIVEQISQTAQKEANAYLFPTVNATAGYNDNITLQPTLVPAQLFNPAAPEGQFEEFTFGRKYVYSAGLQAQWDILNFQKVFAAQTARSQAIESKLNTEKSRYNTYNILASTYYSVVLSQEAIGIYEENTRISVAIFESAQEKYQKGIISDAELNAAEIKQLQDKSILNQYQNNLEQLYVQLQTQLNTRELVELSDKAESFTLEETDSYSPHIEIGWQQAVVQKNESLLKQKKALYYPSLSIFYQYNYSWATDDFFGFSNANSLPQQYFGVKLNVPLFKGFSTRNKITQSEQELHLQKLQLKHTILAKQKEDELLQLQWKQANDQLTQNKKILDLQKQNDLHAENKYQEGIISLDERLRAYDDLLAVQENYLQSMANLALAQYKTYIRQIDFESLDK